jgi:MOSC domain-containing protein YiiM
MPGEILSIWIKRAHGEPMDRVDDASLVAGRGIKGNADQGGWRQVTLIDESAWRNALAEVGAEVDFAARRANVLLRGIDLESSRGKILHLGESVIELLGETRPCEQMNEAQPGLRQALQPHWRAGAYGRIIQGGTIRVGDLAAWRDD